MRIRGTWALASVLGAVAACGGSGSDGTSDSGVPTPSPGDATKFGGVWAGPDGETGIVDLTVTNPSSGTSTKAIVGGAVVSGTLTLSTVVGPVTLSGSIDTTGAIVTLGGTASGALGRFTCANGRITDGRLTITCVGADGVERTIDSRALGVDPIERYCGVMEGGLTGAFNLFTTGTAAGAVFWSGALHGAASGTKAGNAITLSITGREGAANLQLGPSGNDLTGTFAVSGVGSGTVRGSKGACPGGTGVLPSADAGADATTLDAGADATTQDAGADATTADAGRDSGSTDSGSPTDAGRDSGPTDSGSTDAGSTTDSGPGTDAGSSDAGSSDAGSSTDGGGVSCSTGKIVDLDANDYVSYMTVTGGYVFYVKNGNQMWRVPVNGSALPEPFVTSSANTGFWGLQSEDGNVCWLEGSNDPQVLGGLRCRPATGGNAVAVVDNLVTPEGLAYHAGNLYWFSRTGRQIYEATPVSSSAFALKYNMATDLPAPTQTTSITHLAADGEKIFFVADDYQAFQGRVYSIPEGAISVGTSNPVQATDVSGMGPKIGGLASDGRFTYWMRTPTSPLVGLVAAYDKTGVNGGTLDDFVESGGALVAWPGQNQAIFSYKFGIAKHAGNVGGASTIVANASPIAGDSAVRPVAVDATCVYWFGENQGRGVFAKPR